jgi:hypothetical protein
MLNSEVADDLKAQGEAMKRAGADLIRRGEELIAMAQRVYVEGVYYRPTSPAHFSADRRQ